MPRYGPFLFYNNEVKLWFDSEDLGFGGHTYLREYGAELVPQRGVTTILKIIDKSEFLIPWASKRVAEKLAATMPTWEDGLDVYTKCIHYEEFLELVDAAKKAPREILQDAGNVGEEAHRALEDSIKYAINTNGGKVERLVHIPKDPRAVSCCAAALDWMHRHDVKWISTEQKIYSREHEFAGTMDGKASVTSCDDSVCCPGPFTDRLSIIDWKSSNQIAVSYAYQVAAYRKAHMEETGVDVTDAFILRLGKEDGDFEAWHLESDDLGADFETFLSCLFLTEQHENTKLLFSQDNKARTARKRAAAKAEKEAIKLAEKEAKKAAKTRAKESTT